VWPWASLVTQDGVQTPDWEDPWEEDVETLFRIVAWRIPMERGAWRATVHGVEKSWM